jgi:hypothetical protein
MVAQPVAAISPTTTTDERMIGRRRSSVIGFGVQTVALSRSHASLACFPVRSLIEPSPFVAASIAACTSSCKTRTSSGMYPRFVRIDRPAHVPGPRGASPPQGA